MLFNTTPHLSTFIFGLSIAMEEENQRNPEFNEESINAIKTSLMGPLAGIGDSIFWGSLKVIAAGMGIYFAQQGSLLACGRGYFFIKRAPGPRQWAGSILSGTPERGRQTPG